MAVRTCADQKNNIAVIDIVARLFYTRTMPGVLNNQFLLHERNLDMLPFQSTYESFSLATNSVDEYERDLEEAYLQHLKIANEIIYYPEQSDRVPVFELTKRALEYQAMQRKILPLEPLNPNDDENTVVAMYACLEAELHLYRSLDWDLRNKPAHNDPERPRSAVLFGENKKPFAYLKGAGVISAFAWCEADIETKMGLRHIRANSFFYPEYSPTDIHADHLAHKKGGYPKPLSTMMPESIGFLRFSTSILPPSLRHEAAIVGGGPKRADGKLQAFAKMAANHTPERVARKALEILALHRIRLS
jgi:hypothetical protein